MRIVRPVVKTVGNLQQGVRDIARLNEVTRILIRHGYGILLSNDDDPSEPMTFESTPARAVEAIQELGPTFIKLGQVLSTRPDVIPAAYVEAFQSLQDEVQPLPLEEIERHMVAELGVEWRSRLAFFDDEPLATASIAQVHRATLDGGARVVFKIQRPGISPKVNADLNILRLLVSRLVAEFPEASLFDPQGILEEFERSIKSELDFHAEARNIQRFRRNFKGDPTVRIPTVYEGLSTQRVLCIEFLEGVKIRQAREAGYDMAQVGASYLHAAYRMLFDHGFFHGDLHPGNILVLPGGVIGLLDFGMVGTLTRETKDHLVALFFALERGDFRTVARLFFDIAIKSDRVDYTAFERDAIDVVQRNWVGASIADMNIGRYLMELTQGALRHRVRPPQSYTMFFKALLTTEGLAKSLIPEIDPLSAARPYVKRLVTERFSDKRFKEDLFYYAVTTSSVLNRLPSTVSQLLDDLDQQRFRLQVLHQDDPESRDALDRRHNRMILALFATGGAVCGTLALSSDQLLLLGIPLISWVFYLASLPMFLMTLWMTFRNRG